LDGLATLRPVTSGRLCALRRVAASAIPVILSGETGTGKELLARAIHELSGRSGPFIAVNCAALTEPLGAAQLLGHQRGAFTGAVTDAPGFVQAANGGTLLLDEVQELVPTMQATLLRIQDARRSMPGATSTRSACCSTNS
jgi:transcriptional regulator with PAS, ATPase and Fis domain